MQHLMCVRMHESQDFTVSSNDSSTNKGTTLIPNLLVRMQEEEEKEERKRRGGRRYLAFIRHLVEAFQGGGRTVF